MMVRYVAILFYCLAVLGCAPKSQQPNFPRVSGQVTLDGKPVAGATVKFQPERGPAAFGRTDNEGRFILNPRRKTAAVGKNRVTIFSIGRPETIPAKYNSQSSLTFDVPKEGTQNADFQLTSGK